MTDDSSTTSDTTDDTAADSSSSSSTSSATPGTAADVDAARADLDAELGKGTNGKRADLADAASRYADAVDDYRDALETAIGEHAAADPTNNAGQVDRPDSTAGASAGVADQPVEPAPNRPDDAGDETPEPLRLSDGTAVAL